MKVYNQLLKDILENGYDTPDRTGTGRRHIFGMTTRFDISGNKLPLVTNRKIFTKGFIQEMLWFISGEPSTIPLREAGVKIWDEWTCSEDDVLAYLEKYHPDYLAKFPKEQWKDVAIGAHEQVDGHIGPIYGPNWRSWDAPNGFEQSNYLPRQESEIAPAKLAVLKEEYEEAVASTPEDQREQIMPFEQFLGVVSMKSYDQLQELINNLKARPYSSRHIINSWNPTYVPYENLSPQENILMGKSALTACHVLQQYMVKPPLTEGGKPRLSLMMTQR